MRQLSVKRVKVDLRIMYTYESKHDKYMFMHCTNGREFVSKHEFDRHICGMIHAHGISTVKIS